MSERVQHEGLFDVDESGAGRLEGRSADVQKDAAVATRRPRRIRPGKCVSDMLRPVLLTEGHDSQHEPAYVTVHGLDGGHETLAVVDLAYDDMDDVHNWLEHLSYLGEAIARRVALASGGHPWRTGRCCGCVAWPRIWSDLYPSDDDVQREFSEMMARRRRAAREMLFRRIADAVAAGDRELVYALAAGLVGGRRA